MQETGLMPERWPGGPKICEKENLPAFETHEAANAYFKKHCPGLSERQRWECKACGGVHLLGYFHSEKAVSAPLPKNFKPFMRRGYWEEARKNWVGKSKKR